jgi:hypothetical protein
MSVASFEATPLIKASFGFRSLKLETPVGLKCFEESKSLEIKCDHIKGLEWQPLDLLIGFLKA